MYLYAFDSAARGCRVCASLQKEKQSITHESGLRCSVRPVCGYADGKCFDYGFAVLSVLDGALTSFLREWRFILIYVLFAASGIAALGMRRVMRKLPSGVDGD